MTIVAGLIHVTEPPTPAFCSGQEYCPLLSAEELRLFFTVVTDTRFVAAEHGASYEFSTTAYAGQLSIDNQFNPSSITFVFVLHGNETSLICGYYPARVTLDQLYVKIPIIAGSFDEAGMKISSLGPPYFWYGCPGIASP